VKPSIKSSHQTDSLLRAALKCDLLFDSASDKMES
jgi:hypothetical protein